MSDFIDMMIDITNIINPTKGAAERIGCSLCYINKLRIMEKTKDAIKRQLKEQYSKACNGYLVELLRMWELDGHYGYWNSDEPDTIYHYGETHNLTMEDIIYIVENGIEEDEVIAWEDYCLNAYEFGISTPNLMAWHKGCPRTPQEAFERLFQMKEDLNQAVEDEKQRCIN